MLSKFLDGFLGYSYMTYTKHPDINNSLCFVERVDVVLWIKSFTLVSFTTESVARLKVSRYNELWAPKWFKENV